MHAHVFFVQLLLHFVILEYNHYCSLKNIIVILMFQVLSVHVHYICFLIYYSSLANSLQYILIGFDMVLLIINDLIFQYFFFKKEIKYLLYQSHRSNNLLGGILVSFLYRQIFYFFPIISILFLFIIFLIKKFYLQYYFLQNAIWDTFYRNQFQVLLFNVIALDLIFHLLCFCVHSSTDYYNSIFVTKFLAINKKSNFYVHILLHIRCI